LEKKREQNDAVYSVRLLIKAIRDKSDLHHWVSGVPHCESYFERGENAKPPSSTSVCRASEAPFSLDQLRAHLSYTARKLRAIPGFEQIAAGLDLLNADSEAQYRDLEPLEGRLTELEDEMGAIALAQQSPDDVLEIRREANSYLDQYRKRMSREQVRMLERQYFSRRLYERAGLPRLSLFYLDVHSELAA
jgi:hypothetical protein